MLGPAGLGQSKTISDHARCRSGEGGATGNTGQQTRTPAGQWQWHYSVSSGVPAVLQPPALEHRAERRGGPRGNSRGLGNNLGNYAEQPGTHVYTQGALEA